DVLRAVGGQRHFRSLDELVVESHFPNALRHAAGVSYLDPESRTVGTSEHRREAGPAGRNYRIEPQPVARQVEAEHRLHAHAVRPAGGSGVARPPTAADMWRSRVDVGGDHVRLDAVSLRAAGIAAVGDGTHHVEQLHRMVTVT